MDFMNKKTYGNNLVSVIIPIFNVANYLEKSIDSVRNQTYKNLEIILIDDGSTDGSSNLCDIISKKDKRIRVIHKENSGIADARNVGLLNARGEYITFVDSDDWLEKSMIEELLTILKKRNADIIACENYFVYENRVENSRFSNNILSQNSEEAIKTLIEDRKFRSRSWGRIYKFDVWDNVHFPHGKTYEDVSTIYKTYLNAKSIVLVDKPLYFYNQRDGSIVHSKNYKTMFNLLDACMERREYLKKVMPDLLTELNASVIAACIDIYRESALFQEKLTYSENKYLKQIIFRYMGYREFKNLSPRYQSELFVLSISSKLYYGIENELNSLIIHIKRMRK